jgi:excisionase family DNA binding protein
LQTDNNKQETVFSHRKPLEPGILIRGNEKLINEATMEAVSQLPDFMTVEQVANALQLSQNTVRSLLHQHIIPGKKLSQKWIIPRVALMKALSDD